MIEGKEIEAVARTIRELQVMTEKKRRAEFRKAVKFFKEVDEGKMTMKKLENFLEWSKTTDLFGRAGKVVEEDSER